MSPRANFRIPSRVKCSVTEACDELEASATVMGG
jgi:hypothetical protein